MFTSTLTKSSLSRTITPFQQNFNRSFHASSANMAIKTYFDCQWTGPQYTCDINGKVQSKDDSVARE